MLSKYLAAALIGSALIASPALAQSPAPATAAQTKNASSAGLWQGSKLINLNVYDTQNEKIGAIKELMVSKNGMIDSAVIGVGGFLGVGERDVAVKFSDLKWSDQPVANTTGAGLTGLNGGATASKTTHNYPDHAIYNASKDQLKAMPQFDDTK